MAHSLRAAFLTTALLLPISLAAAGTDTRPTAAFREEHAEIKVHLQHIDQMAGALASKQPADQKTSASFVVQFLNDHIRKHAEWEEAHLYPAVDKRTSAAPHRFTTSMRYEHKIVGRSIDELDALAKASSFDAAAFTRKTDRLLGLITAHFEEEEEVLLPILDKSTTRKALEKELGMHAAATPQ